MRFRWLQRLDTLGHKLHLPRWMFRRVCDAYEARLQVVPYMSTVSTSSSAVTWTISRKRHDA
jgi:hypothetical protein